MNRVNRIVSLGLGVALAFVAGRVQALPGQTPDEAQTWIQANPTLRPEPGEKLLIRRSATPAQRFIFRSSLLQAGRASTGPTGGVIRTEEISLFDMLNGITPYRLEESLRSIYGVNVYQDYNRARIIYAYPDQVRWNQAINQNTPLLAAIQGQVRQGDRYAYWLEIARRQDGYAYTGRATVFLKSDLPKLMSELQNR
ncbi:hypothetical protein K9N68_02440 [Kovacikia minuta CCNUW1]|uniref:hypothetical protein n=1 Tax=Kovacikia minuta TaxID=2931930 RepID=UPI001CD02BAC|nr:hypothetical protein [Kovacikia minuta]UBF26867.1 hypothetical protein K9N68_02440 [Kovacikia minuta CCNUW1]